MPLVFCSTLIASSSGVALYVGALFTAAVLLPWLWVAWSWNDDS